jgi:hypothetical protein
MPVEFYKGNIGSDSDEFFKGTLDDLMKHVNEDALVEWDRFTEANGISDIDNDYLRFVKANDVWRAFGGTPQQRKAGRDGFIAEWKPAMKTILMSDGQSPFVVPTGHWSTERSSGVQGLSGWLPSEVL